MRKPLRFWLQIAFLALIVAGIVLLIQSKRTPEWTDQRRAEEIMAWEPPTTLRGVQYETYTARWHEAMDGVRTAKWPLFDLGGGLVLLGLSLLAATYALKIKTVRDMRVVRTPANSSAILAICSLSWFWIAASEGWGIFQDFDRWEFPTWADSIAIPLFFLVPLTLVGWGILASLTWFIAFRRALLPAEIWLWRPDRPLANGIFTALAGLSVGLSLLLVWKVLEVGPFIEMPGVLLWMFATLAVRSAALSRPERS